MPHPIRAAAALTRGAILVPDWIAAPGSEAGASFVGMTTSRVNDPTGWVVGQFECLQRVESGHSAMLDR
jgi:hypothetical protein